jgi:hypothetical protein
MSWQNEITTIVRILINDYVAPYTYSDERLEQTILVAAQYVQYDVNLDNKYTIDISGGILSPDPTSLQEKDAIFINLTGLKTACIVDQSTYRTKAALEGIRAALGPASLSVGGAAGAFKTMLQLGPCATYENLTAHWDIANANAVRAIFSPFVGNNFDPQNLNSADSDHSRVIENQFF